MNSEEIDALVSQMDQEADSLRRQGIKMSWYMRGGATYEDVMNMSFNERMMLNELIKENLETTQKSKLPFF